MSHMRNVRNVIVCRAVNVYRWQMAMLFLFNCHSLIRIAKLPFHGPFHHPSILPASTKMKIKDKRWFFNSF